MSYQTQHLQHTVDYIINQLTYANVREDLKHLSKSDKKWIAAALMQALDPIQSHNPKVIVINKDNIKFHAFFALLDESNIIYPRDVTYLLKRKGTSYEKYHDEKKEIYNRAKKKVKYASRRVTELAEQLEEMLLDDYDDDDDEHRSAYSSEDADEYGINEPAGTFTPTLAAMKDNALRRTCSSQHLLQTISEPRSFLLKSH